MKKLKILVSAYACAPDSGSEPGVGWNFIQGLSQNHEVHVIVEKRKWEKPINNYLQENLEINTSLKFYFIDKRRSKWLRKVWPPSYYWFYKKWQKKAYQLALKLDRQEDFDLIHHLTMVGFREPGYLWKIKKPFVWGPIGGLENSPWRFLPSLGPKGFFFYVGRNIINSWQRKFAIRPKRAAIRSNNCLIAATPESATIIKRLWHKEVAVICEVGRDTKAVVSEPQERSSLEPLKIVWSGVHAPRKNLPLLLKSLSKANYEFELHILGVGEMTKKWQKLAQNLKLESNCKWYGWLDYNKAIDVFKTGHVFVITSISDLTATVTLEALSYGMPIICLNHCGFAHVINEKCGIKIPVENPTQAQIDINSALTKLYHNEQLRQRLAMGAIERASHFSWDKKIVKLNSLYESLTNQEFIKTE